MSQDCLEAAVNKLLGLEEAAGRASVYAPSPQEVYSVFQRVVSQFHKELCSKLTEKNVEFNSDRVYVNLMSIFLENVPNLTSFFKSADDLRRAIG